MDRAKTGSGYTVQLCLSREAGSGQKVGTVQFRLPLEAGNKQEVAVTVQFYLPLEAGNKQEVAVTVQFHLSNKAGP